MESNISVGIATTNATSRVVDKKRNWTSILIPSILGGTVAIITAPTIAALMPVGAVGFIAGTTITSVVGSVTTRITGNAIDSDSITLAIQLYPIQQFYRGIVTQHIGATLDNVLLCIRTNTPLRLSNQVFFEVGDEFRFQGLDAKEQRRMFFDFSFCVIPLAGTTRCALDQSVPPLDLLNYDQDSTRTQVSGNNKGLLAGTGQAVVEGALFGVAGGALGRMFPVLMRSVRIPTVPGKISVIVGMSSVTGIAGPIKNLTVPSTQPDMAALFIEFATEVQCHVNRLVRCAVENGVGLELNMSIGSTSDMSATMDSTGAARTTGAADAPGSFAAQHCDFHWNISETVGETCGIGE